MVSLFFWQKNNFLGVPYSFVWFITLIWKILDWRVQICFTRYFLLQIFCKKTYQVIHQGGSRTSLLLLRPDWGSCQAYCMTSRVDNVGPPLGTSIAIPEGLDELNVMLFWWRQVSFLLGGLLSERWSIHSCPQYNETATRRLHWLTNSGLTL